MEDIKRPKVNFLTISKKTNTPDGIKNRLGITKTMISDPEGIAMETIQNKTQRKKELKNKVKIALMNYEITSNGQIYR